MVNASHLRRLRRSLTVVKLEPGRAEHALRLVFPIAVGLILTSLILGPTEGMLALLGAVAVNTVHDVPFVRRLRLGLGVIAATLLCEAIGLSISYHIWLMPFVMTVITFLALWMWHGLQIGSSGPINILFATAIAAYMGSKGLTVGQLLGATALAWVITMATSMLFLVCDPHAVEKRAVKEAQEAVDAYVDACTPCDGVEKKSSAEDRKDEDSAAAHDYAKKLAFLCSEAWIALENAWHILRTGRTPGTVALTARGRALNARLHDISLRLVSALRNQSLPTERADIATHYDFIPMGKPSAGYLLRTAAQYGSRPLLLATRAATAVLLAGIIAFLIPIGHPYWAILASVLVLHMRTGRADLAIRAAHRIVGTCIGLLVYFAIISLHPTNSWVRLVIVIVAFYCMEVVITRNYALAVIFITVFALIMTPVVSEHDILITIRDRFVETIIGAGCAVLVIWLSNKRAPVLLVRRQYRLTLTILTLCLTDIAAGQTDQTFASIQQLEQLNGIQRRRRMRAILKDPVRTHRRYLVFELVRAGKLLAGQVSDAPGELGRWSAIQREVSAFGYDVVAATWHPVAQEQKAAEHATTQLRAVIAGLPPISSRNINPQQLAGTVKKIHEDFLAAATM